MTDKKNDSSVNDGQEKRKGFLGKTLLIGAVVILAAAAYGWHSYNLPARRLERTLKKADALMEEKNYEEASEAYEQAEGIDGVSPGALEGHILAELYRADELSAGDADIPSRAQACDIYMHVMELCDAAAAAVQDTSDDTFSKVREEADGKRTSLQKGIAAEYEKIECVTQTVDRSDSIHLPDGSVIPYTHYYDLTELDDDYYPYKENINGVLRQQMDAFFTDEENHPSEDIEIDGGSAKEIVYRDYVGSGGYYSGGGLLCVRMAKVQTRGDELKTIYCGTTFRLSDAAQVSLGDLTGRTDIGLRRMVRKKIWAWLTQEGYAEIKKSEVEDYVEDTEPADFKYMIRDDGTVCLIVDQSVPFFADRQEILEIPVEIDENDENSKE